MAAPTGFGNFVKERPVARAGRRKGGFAVLSRLKLGHGLVQTAAQGSFVQPVFDPQAVPTGMPDQVVVQNEDQVKVQKQVQAFLDGQEP